jgi:CrcB protein
MSSTLIVMLGGAIGAAMRYHLSRLAAHWFSNGLLAGWPAATLLVNVSGSFAMGMLAGWMHRHGPSEPWRLLLGVGVLGGFTTFSAFSLEAIELLQSARWLAALCYIGLSVILSLAGLLAGLTLVRAL